MMEKVLALRQQRGGELRYVTEHFHDLQGLKLAPVWAYILISQLLEIDRGSEKAEIATLLAGLVLLWISTVAVGRWYRSRYGLVIRPLHMESLSPWQVCFGIVVVGFGLVTYHLSGNWFCFFLVIATVNSLMPRCFDHSDLLLRRTFYWIVLAALLLMDAWATFVPVSARLLLATMASCWLFLALYDHWILDSTLRRGARSGETAQ
jgi:hypothetical protein